MCRKIDLCNDTLQYLKNLTKNIIPIYTSFTNRIDNLEYDHLAHMTIDECAMTASALPYLLNHYSVHHRHPSISYHRWRCGREQLVLVFGADVQVRMSLHRK